MAFFELGAVHASGSDVNDGQTTAVGAQVGANVGASRRVTALVKTHLQFVWRVLRRRGLSPAEADDAAQQVFMVLHRRIESVVVGAEKAFLFRSAHLVAQDIVRARRRDIERTDTDADTLFSSDDNPEERLDRSQARAVLAMLLGKLSEERRTVFFLYELEQMELAEIAVAMETPIGTVASRLTRARADFQRELDRYRARGAA
jgi:RNA polymerase sigma-70 factor (ECF subfamily)